MDCTIRVAKTKGLISFAVTAKLICVFVFAYAKSRFSHDAAHFKVITAHFYGVRKFRKITITIFLMFDFSLNNDYPLHTI